MDGAAPDLFNVKDIHIHRQKGYAHEFRRHLAFPSRKLA